MRHDFISYVSTIYIDVSNTVYHVIKWLSCIKSYKSYNNEFDTLSFDAIMKTPWRDILISVIGIWIHSMTKYTLVSRY